MPWRTLSMDLAGRRCERLHDYALPVQSNLRELAKQGVRLPDHVQGFFLLRRANLSTQARIAIMTLSGNSLSFSDVRKACKRYADEFLRDPKEHDAHKSHTVCVSQAEEARVTAEEQEGDTDVGTALAVLNEDNDARFGRNRCARDTLGLQGVTTAAWRTTSKPWLQACHRAVPVAENLIELTVDSTSRN